MEDSQGNLLRIGFNRTTQEEDLRDELNKWLKRNYPKMSLKEFFGRLDSFNDNLVVILMGRGKQSGAK